MATSITAVDATNIKPGTGGTVPLDKEIMLSSLAVGNGTLYIATAKGFDNSDAAGVDTCYAPFTLTPPVRQLRLTKGFTNTGARMTASAGSSSQAFGITRTAGTSLVLTGEATSGAATATDTVSFEFDMPDTYVSGAPIAFTVNANFTGTVVTVSTLLLKLSLMTAAGAQSQDFAPAVQTITNTAADYTYTAPAGIALSAGSRVQLTLQTVITTSSGAANSLINSVRYVA